MDLLLKLLMISESAVLIFNAAVRPDNTLLISTIGVLIIIVSGLILIYRRSKKEN